MSITKIEIKNDNVNVVIYNEHGFDYEIKGDTLKVTGRKSLTSRFKRYSCDLDSHTNDITTSHTNDSTNVNDLK